MCPSKGSVAIRTLAVLFGGNISMDIINSGLETEQTISPVLLFNLVDLVSSATIAVSRYPKQTRLSIRRLPRVSKNAILFWWTWSLPPPLTA